MNGETQLGRDPTRARPPVHAVVVAVILVLGAGGGLGLYVKREQPEPEPNEAFKPLVWVQIVGKVNIPAAIWGNATVRPAVQVNIVPQVSGRVVKLDPAMVKGGFFKAGEPLIHIDPVDYDLKVVQASLRLAETEAELGTAMAHIEEAEALLDDANLETDHKQQLYAKRAGTKRELEVARAQRRRAEAVLAAAQAAQEGATAAHQLAQSYLQAAKLALSRTRISLPFDGRILDERIDLGEHLVAGQPVASAYGTDCLEMSVPLEDRELAWLDLPSGSDASPESPHANPSSGLVAHVRADFAGALREWLGYVLRIEGAVDSRSRMVRVVVQVPNPFQGPSPSDHLMPGMFVSVKILGRTLKNVIPVPLLAIREDGAVWIVEDDRLRIRGVRIARIEQEWAYIAEGLSEGDAVVTSALDVVIDRMPVLVQVAPVQAVSGGTGSDG